MGETNTTEVTQTPYFANNIAGALCSTLQHLERFEIFCYQTYESADLKSIFQMRGLCIDSIQPILFQAYILVFFFLLWDKDTL